MHLVPLHSSSMLFIHNTKCTHMKCNATLKIQQLICIKCSSNMQQLNFVLKTHLKWMTVCCKHTMTIRAWKHSCMSLVWLEDLCNDVHYLTIHLHEMCRERESRKVVINTVMHVKEISDDYILRILWNSIFRHINACSISTKCYSIYYTYCVW